MRKKYGLLSVILGTLLATAAYAQQPTRWQPTLESAKRLASQTDRLVLIYFWADWCSVCQRMENEVLEQDAVTSALQNNYVPVKINADHFPATARQFGVTALPTTVILNAQGQPLDKMQGRMEASELIGRLNQVASAVKPPNSDAYAQIAAGPAPGAAQPPDSFRQPPTSPPPTAPNYSSPAVTDGNGYPNWQAQAAPVGPRYNGLASPAADMQGPPTLTQGGLPQQTPPYRSGSIGAPAMVDQSGRMAPGLTDDQRPADPAPLAEPAAGNPPLALDGYCPVSLVDNKTSWSLGDRRWGAIHLGRTYLFAGPEQQRRFLADPDRYAPVMSGNDIVLALDRGQTVPGSREHGLFYGERIYLFASEETLAVFSQAPKQFVDRLEQIAQAQARSGYQRR